MQSNNSRAQTDFDGQPSVSAGVWQNNIPASSRAIIRIEYRSEVLFEMQSVKELTRAAFFYSSSRNTRDFNHEIRAQSEIWLHREYNLAMKNKSLSYTMLHWSIVTHA